MKNTRVLLSSLLMLGLGLIRPVVAAEAAKPGYKVVVEVSIDETGAVEDGKILESDDLSGDQVLNQIAVSFARQIKQPPRLKDGKPVKFTVRAPFNFPVEDDEGAASNLGPRPSLHGNTVVQPVYPAELAAKGEVGGAILEITVNADGYVKNAKVLRFSHQEFADAALAAVKQWVFKPALKDGVPLETRWRLAITFANGDKDVDWRWRVAPRPSLGGFKVVHAKIPPAPAPGAAPAAAAPAVPPAVVPPAPGK